MSHSKIVKVAMVSAFVGALSLFSTAYAAEISIISDAKSLNVGDTFTVTVLLDAQGESVNAVEGKFTFPTGSLEVKNVDLKGSIVNVWAQEPSVATVTKEATGETFSEVYYSGGIAGGYNKSGKMFAVIFSVKAGGTGDLRTANAKVFLNDGKATPAKLTLKDYNFSTGGLTYEQWQALAGYLLKELPSGVKNKFRAATKCGFVAMDASAAGWKVNKAAKKSSYFNDINKTGQSSWCVPASNFAYEASIIKGRSEGVFGMGAVSRYEVATILARQLTQASKETLDNKAKTSFVDDKDIPEWARGPVAYLNSKGIFKGFDLKNGIFKFGGDQNIITIDAAIVLHRTFGVKK